MPPENLRLAADFPSASASDWQRLALAVLRKSGVATESTPADQVEELLSTTTYDGIRIAPLYTSDAPTPETGLPGRAPFVRGATVAGNAAAGWDVRTRHADPDATATAAAIRADLNAGATSVWLVLGEAGIAVEDLPALLHEISLDNGIVLDAGELTGKAAEAFFAFAANGSSDRIKGNLGADPIGLSARVGTAFELESAAALAVKCAEDFPKLRAFTVDATPYNDAGGSDAEELACALATGVAYLRAMETAGLPAHIAMGQLEFRYAATADQFLTIAKLRAARRLWARVAEVCEVPSAGAQHQHAVTSSAMMTVRDPWVNMLRTTIACFAAGVGGAGSITVQPFDSRLGISDDFAQRIARNTSALLMDESNLGRVIDPAGGSWYVEQLTEELAKAAWSIFTEIEGSGGIAAGLADGSIAARLDATWDKRAVKVAKRRAPLTGISEFPNLTEVLPVRKAAPAPRSGGLPQRHYAEVYEAMRDRSDAHLAATGARPTVFLATLGPVAKHTARATFAGNLFAAGGIATVQGGTDTDPAKVAEAFKASGAKIACLCSTDKLYAEIATEVATALSAAGAQKVWLAGKPGDYGFVDSYLYAGCNAVTVLDTTLRDLGVAE